MLKSKRFWLSLGVSLALVLLFVFTVAIKDMADALLNANYLFVLPALGSYFLAVVFRSIRWRYLLSPLGRMSTSRLFPVVVVGYMANNLLPMRLGELVRSYYLGEREGVSKTAGLATILVERVFDGLVLLLFVAFVAIFLPIAGLVKGLGESSRVPWTLLAIALILPFPVLLGILWAVASNPPGLQSVIRKTTGLLPRAIGPKVLEMTRLFIQGLTTLRSPRALLVIFLLSLPIWILETGLFFLIGFSFNLQSHFANLGQMALASLLVTAIANLGASLPSSPGGIGLFELFARETLFLLPAAGIERAVAGAYAVTVHAALLLPIILLGQVFLFKEHVSFFQLSKRGQQTGANYGAPTMSTKGDDRR